MILFFSVVFLLVCAWSWLTHKALRIHLAVREQKWRIDDLERDLELSVIAHENHTRRHVELCERISRNEELARERSRRIRRRVRAIEPKPQTVSFARVEIKLGDVTYASTDATSWEELVKS